MLGKLAAAKILAKKKEMRLAGIAMIKPDILLILKGSMQVFLRQKNPVKLVSAPMTLLPI